MSTPEIFFFVGTEAELIKVFPVMLAVQGLGVNYKLIASGQNDIANSRILQRALNKQVDLALSDEASIQKSALGLIKWFLKTKRTAAAKIRAAFPEADFSKSIFVVHGDTVSTYMGAAVGKKLGAAVAHVEAGLRSHHLLNPFPEEIDRILTSRKANMHFAPGQIYCENLKKKSGVVNTNHNTIIDSLSFSAQIPAENESLNTLSGKNFFVYVLHRQENLANTNFLAQATRQAIELSAKLHAVVVLHKPTEIAFEKAGLLSEMQENPNITLLPRMDYFDFMKLLHMAKFVVTDGGSNQEELHYMGKPTLIMRSHTERQQGLGTNAKLYGGDVGAICRFYSEYESMASPPTHVQGTSPSQIIAEVLCNKLLYYSSTKQ